MAQFSEQRRVRYYGRWRLPQDAINSKNLVIDVQLVRGAKTEYRNFIYRPESKTDYGIVLFLKDEFVMSEVRLNFNNQRIYSRNNDIFINMSALRCVEIALRNNIRDFATALGVTVVRLDPVMNNFKFPTLDFDTVQVCLREEQMLAQITGAWNLIETCGDEDPPPDRQTPPPPPVRLPNPFPGTTPDNETDFTPDPPYEFPDDNGGTYNPDGAGPDDPFPVGDQCQIVRVSGTAIQTNPDGQTFSFAFSREIYGEVVGASVEFPPGSTDPNQHRFVAQARGRVDSGQCSPEIIDTLIIDGLGNRILPGGFEVQGVQYEVL